MSCDYEDKKDRKNKLEKRKIDIESEFVGAVPPHRKKKEKKSDCTEEIKKFLAEPITLEGIKAILMRVYRYNSDNIRNKIRVISIKKTNHMNEKYNGYDFFIYIHSPKQNHYYEFLLSHWNFVIFDLFSVDKLDTSILKQQLANALRKWFENNLNQTTRVEI